MKRFFPYYKKYLFPLKGYFIAALLAGVIYGAASGAGLPWVLKRVLPEVFSHNDIPLRQLFLVAAYIPAIFLVRGVSQFINTYMISFCGFKVVEGIQLDLYRALQKLPLKFFNKNKSGDLLSRLTGDAQAMRAAIVDIANDIIIQPMQLIGSIGFLVYLSIQKSEALFLLVCIGSIPLCVFPIRLIGKKLFRKAKTVQAQAGEMTASVTDSLQAPMEIRAYNMQESVADRFADQVHTLLKARMKVVKYDKLLGPIIDVISACGIAVTIVYAGKSGMNFEGEVLPLLTALYMSYDPIKKLGKVSMKLQKATASLDRVEYILHHENDLLEPEHPVAFEDVEGAVQFENIVFAYDDDVVLKHIDLSVPAGQVVAMVGPSGAGKSTLASLVPRFYDVAEGRILIDGHDVRDIRKYDLRESISIVTQSPVLFNETVMENIRIGRPSATDEEVYEAARKAYAYDFVEKLDGGEGFQTLVGEKGTRLSGGQRQRIAIARAFLKDAPILILDEATSALDSESEARIQLALEDLVKGRTTFIIAHRFSTIKIADRILVFNQGEIIADGAHEEIYDDCSLYRELYDQQSG